MSREGEFIVFCIEIYKSAKLLSGKNTVELFKKYEVFEYLNNYFEFLHTMGEKYIVNDIDSYIETKKIN